jgi:hypothetical protein
MGCPDFAEKNRYLKPFYIQNFLSFSSFPAQERKEERKEKQAKIA